MLKNHAFLVNAIQSERLEFVPTLAERALVNRDLLVKSALNVQLDIVDRIVRNALVIREEQCPAENVNRIVSAKYE